MFAEGFDAIEVFCFVLHIHCLPQLRYYNIYPQYSIVSLPTLQLRICRCTNTATVAMYVPTAALPVGSLHAYARSGTLKNTEYAVSRVFQNDCVWSLSFVRVINLLHKLYEQLMGVVLWLYNCNNYWHIRTIVLLLLF